MTPYTKQADFLRIVNYYYRQNKKHNLPGWSLLSYEGVFSYNYIEGILSIAIFYFLK